MPYIVKQIKVDSVDIDHKQTLILDVNKTNNLTKELDLVQEKEGISYKELINIQKTFGNIKLFKDFLIKKDEHWNIIIAQVDNINEFYNILWEKTITELMFLSQYYLSLISTPESFDQLAKTRSKFEYWFKDIVKYNMLERINSFYFRIAKTYANKTTINIYETDVEIKAKEILKEIENNHLPQIQEFLKIKWDETEKEYKIWKEKQEQKRKSIIFD